MIHADGQGSAHTWRRVRTRGALQEPAPHAAPHHPPPAHRRAPFVLALGAAIALLACKTEPDQPGEEHAGEPAALLVNRRVPGAPLELRIPQDWKFDRVDPGPLPAPPLERTSGQAPLDGGVPLDEPSPSGAADESARLALALQSRTLLSARAPTGALGDAGRPWLMVFHDPYLPAGTTSSTYLQAQRESNRDVTRLEHVEAEHSLRQGRSGYYVRDAFLAPFGERKVRMSQESLLLVDPQGDQLHGYAVVITALEDDRERLRDTLRAILDSVRFARD